LRSDSVLKPDYESEVAKDTGPVMTADTMEAEPAVAG
jgi:hypothetical protein